MRLKATPFICILLLFISSLALAQREVGNFVGSVEDEEGNPLPGVSITAKNAQTGLTQSTITNAQGRYRIERIDRGIYTLTAALQGFKTLSKEKIELYSGGENRIDFKLEIGKIEEEVTVIGETPMVETTRSQVSTVMTEKEILSYPQANRNFLNLMAYAPGTLPNAPTIGGTGFAVNGMRGESNNFMLDGFNNNDMTDNSQYTGVALLPPEAIQEFRLVSNNFNVESARNTGAQLNVVMKSGTNELHGSGWLFFRGDSALFRSEDWLTHERPDYSRKQYGATLGGPIIKDKTFFFASFEGVDQKIAAVQNPYLFTREAKAAAMGAARTLFDAYGANLPDPTYSFIDADGDGIADYGRANLTTEDTFKAYTGAIKLDHIFGPKDRITFRWVLNYQTQKLGYGYYWVPGQQLEQPRDTHTGGMTWLHLFSPTAYNEVRVGYHREHWEEMKQDSRFAAFAFYDEPKGFGDPGYPMYQLNQTYQITDVMNFQVGNHSLKFGGELRYWRAHCMFDADVLGQYVYYSGMDFIRGNSAGYLFIGCDPPNPPEGNPYVKGPDDGEWKSGFDLTWRKWKGVEAGVFIQDDWRVSNRLTVSAGLRWDYYSVPTEFSGAGINQPAYGTQQGFETGQLIEGVEGAEGIRYLIFDGRELLGKGLWNPYYGCFAPKVSFAYDLTGDGKTSIRGGYGIGYERQMNRNYENDRFNYPDFAFVQFPGSPSDPSFADLYPTLPGGVPGIENRAGYRSSLRWMDPNLKPQMAHNWLIGFQRELAQNVSIELNYSGSRGRRIGTLTPYNRFTGDGVDGRYTGINPYAGIRDVYNRANLWTSNYDSFQVILNKRFSNGWSWYTSYTYGKSMDYVSAYQFGTFVSAEVDEIDWGSSDYDYRHRMVGGFVYDLPFFKQSKNWIMKNILAGWQIAASFHVTSGQPFSIYGSNPGTDYNKDGIRWDYPLWLGSDNKDALQWNNGMPYFDRSQFGTPNAPANGYYDSATNKIVNDLSYYDQKFVKRNQFHWFPTSNIDISLQKYFTIPVGGREITLQFIGEVFNLMRSRIWAQSGDISLPVQAIQLSSFGQVTRMNGDRTAQVSLRIMF